MNIKKVKQMVKEYEASAGTEAQNFRQRINDNPQTVYEALMLDMDWHLSRSQETVQPLRDALNLASWDVYFINL